MGIFSTTVLSREVSSHSNYLGLTRACGRGRPNFLVRPRRPLLSPFASPRLASSKIKATRLIRIVGRGGGAGAIPHEEYENPPPSNAMTTVDNHIPAFPGSLVDRGARSDGIEANERTRSTIPFLGMRSAGKLASCQTGTVL
jgi:hypothetical protein